MAAWPPERLKGTDILTHSAAWRCGNPSLKVNNTVRKSLGVKRECARIIFSVLFCFFVWLHKCLSIIDALCSYTGCRHSMLHSLTCNVKYFFNKSEILESVYAEPCVIVVNKFFSNLRTNTHLDTLLIKDNLWNIKTIHRAWQIGAAFFSFFLFTKFTNLCCCLTAPASLVLSWAQVNLYFPLVHVGFLQVTHLQKDIYIFW